ncbi:hypothetical protein NLG42_20345 [Flavobacterium plurextorum]|uniref:hypothetical protein n=1 Tax=Flavobacterium TaxID=237 RepID=UPI00214DBED1|nr:MULTISPECIES: hypothetical protein [Flavobacterium]UUW08447.1 hypothetical protein NLG42_20345 [Flavobacterium plurextorum]
MWTLYSIGFLTILFCIIYNTIRKKKAQVTSKFSILIHLLLKLDKELVVENDGKDDITLFSSNLRGAIAVFFAQYSGIISIIIESNTIENNSQRREWIFLDNLNQYLIFNLILNDLQSFHNSSFDQQILQKLIDKSNHNMQRTILSNGYSPYNIAQSLFVIAFSEVEKINNFQKISQKGSFEVLFFNCVVTLQKSNIKQQNELWNQLLTLLIFYLENHNLMNQIKDVEKLLTNRLALYGEQIQEIKSNPDYDYNRLYDYFFVKPLKLHSKIKSKVIQTSSLSRRIQMAGFSKMVLFMIADIEEKLPILQNLIF